MVERFKGFSSQHFHCPQSQRLVCVLHLESQCPKCLHSGPKVLHVIHQVWPPWTLSYFSLFFHCISEFPQHLQIVAPPFGLPAALRVPQVSGSHLIFVPRTTLDDLLLSKQLPQGLVDNVSDGSDLAKVCLECHRSYPRHSSSKHFFFFFTFKLFIPRLFSQAVSWLFVSMWEFWGWWLSFWDSSTPDPYNLTSCRWPIVLISGQTDTEDEVVCGLVQQNFTTDAPDVASILLSGLCTSEVNFSSLSMKRRTSFPCNHFLVAQTDLSSL